jgi:predicted ribosome quality control (RQC) complex YloA/Tae2 family protein
MKFREFVLSTGRKVFGGKDAESNDELVKTAKRNDVILHTLVSGSPFVNVGEKPMKKEIKEAAVFCARFSQDWRDNKKDIVVNVFLRGDMKKGLFAKAGSWKVGKSEKLVVKKSEIEKLVN